MKGVLICGGTGSRLRPLTEITNKSLLPVYDKPLICYPLQHLLDAEIKEIAVIAGPEQLGQMTTFLGSGSRFGCRFAFIVQEKPEGIAQALGLVEDFAAGDDICAILGDNIFFDDLTPAIKGFRSGGHVFLKEVPDPQRFGVANIDGSAGGGSLHVTSIEEKPSAPKSNLAVTGCYLYDNTCFSIIRSLKPSKRGELEITDVSSAYLAKGQLTATTLSDTWIDAGTFESLFAATSEVRRRKSIHL